MPTSNPDDALKILQAIADSDQYDSVWWRTDDEYAPVSFFVNCNDVFWWACSDTEDLTVENLPVFIQACKEARSYGPELFCARIRGMRPQGAYYRGLKPEIAALFDACGPERPVERGNTPKPTQPNGKGEG